MKSMANSKICLETCELDLRSRNSIFVNNIARNGGRTQKLSHEAADKEQKRTCKNR